MATFHLNVPLRLGPQLLNAKLPDREWSRGDTSDIDGPRGRNERERMSQSSLLAKTFGVRSLDTTLFPSEAFRSFGGDNVGARGQTATTSSLNDFARNASVLIKQIDGAHSVIAICDDDFPIAWISDEQQRRKFLAGRDFHMILSYVRIGYAQ
jgi:hypothetical protein